MSDALNPWAVRILRCRDMPLSDDERVKAWTSLLSDAAWPSSSSFSPLDNGQDGVAAVRADVETVRVDCERIYHVDDDMKRAVATWLCDAWVRRGMPYMQGFHAIVLHAMQCGCADNVGALLRVFGLRAYMPERAEEVRTVAGNTVYVRSLGPTAQILDQFWTRLTAEDVALASHLERFPETFAALLPCYVSMFASVLNVPDDISRLWDDMIALEVISSGAGTLYVTFLLVSVLHDAADALFACQDGAQVATLVNRLAATAYTPVRATIACRRALTEHMRK